jgi:hypothetical protein
MVDNGVCDMLTGGCKVVSTGILGSGLKSLASRNTRSGGCQVGLIDGIKMIRDEGGSGLPHGIQWRRLNDIADFKRDLLPKVVI